MNFKNNQKCACEIMERVGPPPLFALSPPPMPPLPLQFGDISILDAKAFESFLKCSNKPKINNQLMANSIQMTNSYYFIITIIIVVLIVFLIFFILTALIIVYITRLKLKKSNLNRSKNSSQSSNKHESQQTVSVLSLTSPSFTQISNSPNSTASYTSSAEEPNLMFEQSKVVALNSFSKLPLHENTFKPIQMSSSICSGSSASPNKQSIGSESIDTNRTTFTVLTQARSTRPQRYPMVLQSENQQHYYESIGDVSQVYFDVDDQNYRKNIARCAIPEVMEVNCPIQPTLQEHFPITCCSCTLMKYNHNLNHSCSNPIRNSHFNLNSVQYCYDNSRDIGPCNNQLSSNKDSSSYLKSLLV
ncbi:hypothetical protein BpHYR1_016712 [Brachionus plicatilis]|uniref:Uncharacterized protein n=1 Tax=Brachionus plicatilis TaxID=10195 RepID=A0A3M7QKF6_BRAPC|nr:hypothetical protein BpHYR1_016712 [Brachionus plicatilis]